MRQPDGRKADVVYAIAGALLCAAFLRTERGAHAQLYQLPAEMQPLKVEPPRPQPKVEADATEQVLDEDGEGDSDSAELAAQRGGHPPGGGGRPGGGFPGGGHPGGGFPGGGHPPNPTPRPPNPTPRPPNPTPRPPNPTPRPPNPTPRPPNPTPRPPNPTHPRPPQGPSHPNPDRGRVPPPQHKPSVPPVAPKQRPGDHLKQAPAANAGEHKLPQAPDGKDRQHLAKMSRDIHNVTIVNNANYINNTVLGARGWHHNNGIYYYHHPDYYGFIGIAYGNYWFWTYYHLNNWWWYYPRYGRWLVWRDAYWWYWDPAFGWSIWYADTDTFYRAGEGSVTPLPPPDQQPPATPPQEEMYRSEDGSMVAYVKGDKKECHLYYAAEAGLQHVAYLGEGVDKVRFFTDKNTKDLVVQVSFNDGSVALYNSNGDFYGPPPSGGGDQAGVQGVIGGELPEASFSVQGEAAP